jgi:hypothetical protein
MGGDATGIGVAGQGGGTVMVSSSRVTAPFLARARPLMVSPVVTVMEARARMLPRKEDPAGLLSR